MPIALFRKAAMGRPVFVNILLCICAPRLHAAAPVHWDDEMMLMLAAAAAAACIHRIK